MNTLKKDKNTKSHKQMGIQKKGIDQNKNKKDHQRKISQKGSHLIVSNNINVNMNMNSPTNNNNLYKTNGFNHHSQKAFSSNIQSSIRNSVITKTQKSKNQELVFNHDIKNNQIKNNHHNNQTRKKTFVSPSNNNLSLQAKLQDALQQLALIKQQKEDFQQKILNQENKLKQKQKEIIQINKQNQDLKNKLNKMKQRSQQNKKALRSKINQFNNDGQLLVKLQSQIDKLRQENQILKQQLKKTKENQLLKIQENKKQQKRSILGVNKVQLKQKQFFSNQNQSNINKIELNQAFEAMLKQISQSFSNRTQQYRQRITQQQSQIQKLQAIIDRYYEQNQGINKNIPINIDTNQQLLQQIQANQKLKQQNKELKQKIILFQIENQSLLDKYKDSLCYLEVERIKSQGIVIKKCIQQQQFKENADSAISYGFSKGQKQKYFKCKCQNDQQILKSQIQRLKVQIQEAKRLGQMYFQDNKKKQELIIILSSSRKANNVYK